MTEPSDPQAEPGPEVKPEMIQDLDVTGEDADGIAGGCSWTHTSFNQE